MDAKHKLKKLLRTLNKIEGRHTELITVYIPYDANIIEIVNQLRQEISTAENIKSKQVRKNVISALEKIIRELQFYKKTPKNGLAIFCGNVSEKEGVSNIEIWIIEPPEPLKTKLYWCDQKFVLEGLEEMIKEKEVYGLVCLDKSEADIAWLKGTKIEIVTHFDSIVPGKSRAGGQSSMRFSRIREGLLVDYLKKVAEAVNKTFSGKKFNGIIVSGPGPIKDYLLKEDYLSNEVKNKILGTVDVGATGIGGLEETIIRAESILKEARVMKEKKILQKFFTFLPNQAVYGLEKTLKSLQMGVVETILVSEDAPYEEIEYECKCGKNKRIMKIGNEYCKNCSSRITIKHRRDIIDALEDLAVEHGIEMVVVSRHTQEGRQFFELGAIGAILRYKIEVL